MAKLITETCSGMLDETSKHTSDLLSCLVNLIKHCQVTESHLSGQFFPPGIPDSEFHLNKHRFVNHWTDNAYILVEKCINLQYEINSYVAILRTKVWLTIFSTMKYNLFLSIL